MDPPPPPSKSADVLERLRTHLPSTFLPPPFPPMQMHFRILRASLTIPTSLVPPRIKAWTPTRRDIDVPVSVHTVIELVRALLARATVAVLAVRLSLALAAVGVDVLAVAVLVVARVLARVGDLAARVGRAVGALLRRVALEGVLVEVALDVVARHVRGLDAADALALVVPGARGATREHADVGCGGWADGRGHRCGVGGRARGSADTGGSGGAALRRIL